MTDEPPEGGGRRRVRRGEGEVTEWPRGLVEYVPSGAPDGVPSPEEDRDLNRLRLAARLAGFARSQGLDVEGVVGRLHEAEEALRRGDRTKSRRLVDSALTDLERAVDRPRADRSEPSP